MARSSNPEDPENAIDESVDGFVQEEGFQLGWGGMAQALNVRETEKEFLEEEQGR